MSSADQVRYNMYSQGSTGWSILRNEEFQEEDVWRLLRKTKQSYSRFESCNEEESSSSTMKMAKYLPSSASKMIPKPENKEPIIVQRSAPVNIPDWSKIYGITSKKPSQNASLWLDCDDHGENEVDGVINNSWDSDQDEDDDESLIPPHEWIAKKLARTLISSFSVCEGVGRTLKGRDLSNVRHAVLTRTGFLE